MLTDLIFICAFVPDAAPFCASRCEVPEVPTGSDCEAEIQCTLEFIF